MHFGKPSAILLLKNTSIDLFTDGATQKDSLSLPKGLVKNLAIKDQEQFKELLLDFFARNSLKNQKVLIILSEDVLIQKTLEVSTEEAKKKEEEEFVKEIPVEEEKQMRILLTDEKNTFFIATNRALLTPLEESLGNVGASFLMVVPITLFEHLEEKNTISLKEAQIILQNIKDLSVGDFLAQKKSVAQKPSFSQVPQKEKLITLHFLLLLLFIGLATSLLVFAGLITGVLDVRFEKLQSFLKFSFVTPTPTVLPTPTEQPKVTITKEELTIQVFNGTGTPGQAGEVRDLLTEAEFKNIEVGDAEEQSEDRDAEVVFSQKVSDDEQKEIKKILEDNFASVSAKEDSELSDFDIVITTGAAKERE